MHIDHKVSRHCLNTLMILKFKTPEKEPETWVVFIEYLVLKFFYEGHKQ